jgi:hypothetical protein
MASGKGLAKDLAEAGCLGAHILIQCTENPQGVVANKAGQDTDAG